MKNSNGQFKKGQPKHPNWYHLEGQEHPMWVEIESELLISLRFGNQLTNEEIAELFRCSIPTVISRMKKYTIPTKKRDIYIEKELIISLYWGLGYTMKELSSIFDCSNSYISNLMNKYNILRREVGLNLKENNPWIGRKHTYSTKRKLSEIKTGIKQLPESIRKRIESRKGYTHSQETRRRISEANKGKRIQIEEEDLIKEYKDKHMTLEEVSELHNCSPDTISRRLKEYNISIRKQGQSRKGNAHTLKYYGKKGIRLSQSHLEKIWRKKIYKRDNYTCQECGVRGGELNAHHIKSWRDYSELRLDIDNGITLCRRCHMQVHHPNSHVKIDGIGRDT